MKFLKKIARRLAARLSGAWEKVMDVNYETYLRQREMIETHEKVKMRYMHYRGGGWL